MISRKYGSRWPIRGAPRAWATRGLMLLGPGPIRIRLGTANWPGIKDISSLDLSMGLEIPSQGVKQCLFFRVNTGTRLGLLRRSLLAAQSTEYLAQQTASGRGL